MNVRPHTIWSMASLAATYHMQGRYDEAERSYVEVLELRREVLGEKHPDTIGSMASLAAIYHAQGRYDEAEKSYVEVLALGAISLEINTLILSRLCTTSPLPGLADSDILKRWL
jgi:tetratricopeptide (TPR) repeat protein